VVATDPARLQSVNTSAIRGGCGNGVFVR